jgi:hypothetical protein
LPGENGAHRVLTKLSEGQLVGALPEGRAFGRHRRIDVDLLVIKNGVWNG